MIVAVFAVDGTMAALIGFFAVLPLFLPPSRSFLSSRVFTFPPRRVLALSSEVSARTASITWASPPPRMYAPPQVRFFHLWCAGASFVTVDGASRVQAAFIGFFGFSVPFLRLSRRRCSSRVCLFLPRFVLALSPGVRARTDFTVAGASRVQAAFIGFFKIVVPYLRLLRRCRSSRAFFLLPRFVAFSSQACFFPLRYVWAHLYSVGGLGVFVSWEWPPPRMCAGALRRHGCRGATRMVWIGRWTAQLALEPNGYGWR